jgi:hypothetical protein
MFVYLQQPDLKRMLGYERRPSTGKVSSTSFMWTTARELSRRDCLGTPTNRWCSNCACASNGF